MAAAGVRGRPGRTPVEFLRPTLNKLRKKIPKLPAGRSWQRRRWDRGSRQPGRCFCFSSCAAGGGRTYLHHFVGGRLSSGRIDTRVATRTTGSRASERPRLLPSIHNGRHYGYYPSLRCNLVSPRIYTLVPTGVRRSLARSFERCVYAVGVIPCLASTTK